MTLKMSTTIKEENGAWIATDIIETPGGAATDTATLEEGTLVLLKRSVKQGPVTINVEFANDKATGSMSMNGQDKPISVDVGGPVFADAAAASRPSARCRSPMATTPRFATSMCRSRRPS